MSERLIWVVDKWKFGESKASWLLRNSAVSRRPARGCTDRSPPSVRTSSSWRKSSACACSTAPRGGSRPRCRGTPATGPLPHRNARVAQRGEGAGRTLRAAPRPCLHRHRAVDFQPPAAGRSPGSSVGTRASPSSCMKARVDQIQDDLHQRLTDFAIGPRFGASRDLAYEPIFIDRFVAVLPRNVAIGPSVSLRELRPPRPALAIERYGSAGRGGARVSKGRARVPPCH